MSIDSHCHIHFKAYAEDREAVIARTREKGWRMVAIGTSLNTSADGVALAQKYPGLIVATVGLHPVHLFSTYVDELEGDIFKSHNDEFDREAFLKLAVDPSVVAIGETGLDYYHIEKAENKEKEIAKQKQVFVEQLKLAHEVGKPLVIHCREALRDLAVILKEHESLLKPQHGERGVIHCYTGTWAEAEPLIAMGFCIGFTGVITYKPKASEPERQAELLKTVKNTPLERILVETDSPYLAPVPYRGKRAEPWMAEEVLKKIAEVRGESLEVVSQAIEANTKKLFFI